MLIYEKNNKLNINFDNEVSENPDLQINKEDGKTEVLIDGQPSGGGALYAKLKTETHIDPETGEESEEIAVYTDEETGEEYCVLDKTYSEIIEAKNNNQAIIVETFQGRIGYPIYCHEGYGLSIITMDRSCFHTPMRIACRRDDSDLLRVPSSSDNMYMYIQESASLVAEATLVAYHELDVIVYSTDPSNHPYGYGIPFTVKEEIDAETGENRYAIRYTSDAEEYNEAFIIQIMHLIINKLGAQPNHKFHCYIQGNRIQEYDTLFDFIVNLNSPDPLYFNL